MTRGPKPRTSLLAILLLGAAAPAPAQDPVRAPRLWDPGELAGWATPVAGLGVPPAHASAERYYALRVDNLRTYPVYHPSREPEGYREGLLRKGPQPLIDQAQLRTEADWLAAGQRVFEELDTALSRTDDPRVIAHFTDAKSVDAHRDADHDVVTKDGILLDYRWVVDLDGRLKLSFSSCAGCHTRLLPDGSLLPGAPCNFDISDAPAVGIMLKQLRLSEKLSVGENVYAQFGVPWRPDDVHAKFKAMPDREVGAFLGQQNGAPPGTTFARFNGSPFWTTRMADLRGISDRRYLDATGTHVNRGPADLARYAILVEFVDVAEFGPHKLLPPDVLAQDRPRPPDEAMYAMALWLWSLEPAPSPQPLDEQARAGEKVFAAERCAKCHPAPAYTDNLLHPVEGFEPPKDDPRTARLHVADRTIDTDPGLALRTRKGTGYYRTPSLRGLWYRGLFEHSGSVASLEDWFDANRLRADYVPSGFRGPGVPRRAVPGHEFGLDLEPPEKAALIAFLRTL
jgi:mono/diheme cytochrome c family protein